MNLFAHTAIEGYVYYPPYISLNQSPNGKLILTIRGAENKLEAGKTVDIVIDAKIAHDLGWVLMKASKEKTNA